MTSIADLQAKFQEADKNADGLLSIEELSAANSISTTEATSLIDYFCAGDEMTLSEYILMTKVLKSDVSGVFKMWDKDQSGILDPSELTDLKTIMKVSDSQWADILDRVDLDKDGKIDAKEFVLLCQTLNKKDSLAPKKVRKAAPAPQAAASSAGDSKFLAIVGVVVIAVVFAAYRNGTFDSLLGKKKN